jgi:hypothetical protein
MATVLFSLPVHESNETIRDTIANVRRFNGPDHSVMIHVDANWQGFDHSIADIDYVYVNPMRWPTGHAHSQIPTHVSNYMHATKLGLTFSHLAILHTSELFVRDGMSDHINDYAHSLWFTANDQPVDHGWPPLIHVSRIWPELDTYLGNLIEGSWYHRDLFDAMTRYILHRFDLAQLVLPYALEECLFPSLAWRLAKSQPYTNPYCAFKHDQHFLSDRAFVDDIRLGKPVTFWQPHNFVYDYAPFDSNSIYSVKRIARDLADPIRSYIRQL